MKEKEPAQPMGTALPVEDMQRKNRKKKRKTEYESLLKSTKMVCFCLKVNYVDFPCVDSAHDDEIKSCFAKC